MPVLVEGRDLLREELGRDKELVGSSVGKKFDFRRRGDGEGGTWDNVSTVLSSIERPGEAQRMAFREILLHVFLCSHSQS